MSDLPRDTPLYTRRPTNTPFTALLAASGDVFVIHVCISHPALVRYDEPKNTWIADAGIAFPYTESNDSRLDPNIGTIGEIDIDECDSI